MVQIKIPKIHHGNGLVFKQLIILICIQFNYYFFFKCLTEIAQTKEKIETTTERGNYFKAPDNVITRGML